MATLKKSLTHRIHLQKKQLKRLHNETKGTASWADLLLTWVEENHTRKEVELLRNLLKRGFRHPIPVARHNARTIETLEKSKVLVVSQVGAPRCHPPSARCFFSESAQNRIFKGFAILAKAKNLEKVYSHGETPPKGISSPNDHASSPGSPDSPQTQNLPFPFQQGHDPQHGDQKRTDAHPVQDGL